MDFLEVFWGLGYSFLLSLLTLSCTVFPLLHTILMWIKNLFLCVSSLGFFYCEWSENNARPEPAAALMPIADSCPGSVPSPRLSEHIATPAPAR